MNSGGYKLLIRTLLIPLLLIITHFPTIIKCDNYTTVTLYKLEPSTNCHRISSTPTTVGICSDHGKCVQLASAQYNISNNNQSTAILIPDSISYVNDPYCECDDGWNSANDYIK